MSLYRSLLLEETGDRPLLRMIPGQPQGSLAQREGAKPMMRRKGSAEKMASALP